MPMQMIGRPILRKQVRLLNGSPSVRKLIFLDQLSLLQAICYRNSKYLGWYPFFCFTDLPLQHCGLLLIWPSPIGWRFLDIPSVQLPGISSDARIFPYIWTPVLQLRHFVQTCCIFYSQFVSILSPALTTITDLFVSVEYTGYILPVISMKRWLFWIVSNVFEILYWLCWLLWQHSIMSTQSPTVSNDGLSNLVKLTLFQHGKHAWRMNLCASL